MGEIVLHDTANFAAKDCQINPGSFLRSGNVKSEASRFPRLLESQTAVGR